MLWLFLGSDAGDGGSGGVALTSHQVQSLPPCFGQDSRVRLINKASNCLTQPVIAAGVAGSLVHPLLDNCPRATAGK
ncbi:hypothetical protein ES703_96428 [subsurface metagenome]